MEVIKACSTFFLYAVTAIFAENAVFGRAMGVSRLVKLVEDSTVDTLTFGGLLCLIQLVAAPLTYWVNLLLTPLSWRNAVRPFLFILCSTVAFFVVLGVLLIAATQSFNLLQTMGFALGSGVGYTAAVVVVGEGQRRMRQDMVPGSFKGLPITLIYIGILALAIYGFTGHRISIG